MPRHTSPATKARIVTMVDYGGMTYAEIAKEVGRAPTTVSRIYDRYHQSHDFDHVAPRSGRPRKLTKSDTHFLRENVQ
jgi:transposase